MMGLLLFPLGCITDPFASQLLQPSELCSDYPDDARPTFEDRTIGNMVYVMAWPEVDNTHPLTCGIVSALEKSPFENPQHTASITSLVGLQNLTSLTRLALSHHLISDISPLSGLTSLTRLELDENLISDISPLSGLRNLTRLELKKNSITDISALSGLTSLTWLDVGNNSITDIRGVSGLTNLTELRMDENSISDISALGGLTGLFRLNLDNNPDLTDIQPLLDNTELGSGQVVFLRNTNVSCADVAALKSKGVGVWSDCP